MPHLPLFIVVGLTRFPLVLCSIHFGCNNLTIFFSTSKTCQALTPISYLANLGWTAHQLKNIPVKLLLLDSDETNKRRKSHTHTHTCTTHTHSQFCFSGAVKRMRAFLWKLIATHTNICAGDEDSDDGGYLKFSLLLSVLMNTNERSIKMWRRPSMWPSLTTALLLSSWSCPLM